MGGEFVEEEKVGTDMVWVRSFELTEAKCMFVGSVCNGVMIRSKRRPVVNGHRRETCNVESVPEG